MSVSPEDRQQAIDVMRQALIEGGMPEDQAPDLAAELVDQAIAAKQ